MTELHAAARPHVDASSFGRTSLDATPLDSTAVAALEHGARVTTVARAAARTLALVSTTALLVAEGRLDNRTTPTAFAARAQRTARKLLGSHGVHVSAVGSPPEGPAILVANHVSYIDPLAVACVSPCIAIAKGETLGWPLIGAGLRALGVVFVRRGDAHSGARVLRSALRALRAGASVLNFPEGTTGDGRRLGPFRRGIFGLARIAGLPVVPTHIGYDDPRVPWFGARPFAPHYFELAQSVRVHARVRFGTPVRLADAHDPEVAATLAHDAVESLGHD